MSAERFTIWYRCQGKPSGTHSGFTTEARARAEAEDAVFGVWSAADEAKITNGPDRVIARFAA